MSDLFQVQSFSFDFDALILSKEAKRQLELLILGFKNSDVLATYNLRNKQKILLCGEPGIGKTFSVQAISSVLKVPVIYVDIEKALLLKNLKKIFKFIRSGTWIVLFEDDKQESLLKRIRKNLQQELVSIKNSLIFLETRHPIIDIWDGLDDIVFYELPDKENRERLFNDYLRPLKRERGLVVGEKILDKTDGFSHADIKNVVESAMSMAILSQKSSMEISSNDINDSVDILAIKRKIVNGY